MDVADEMRWARNFAESCPKNYQIWQHRQALVLLAPLTSSEELNRMIIGFESEPKNYHAWQYRQWLLKTFGGSLQDELDHVNELVRLDPYNNSAWNHRYFILFSEVFAVEKNESWWADEIKFANDKLAIDDTNQSVDLYLEQIKEMHNKN